MIVETSITSLKGDWLWIAQLSNLCALTGRLPHAPRLHPEQVWYAIRQGSVSITIGECERQVGPGEVVVVSPNTLHCWAGEGDIDALYFHPGRFYKLFATVPAYSRIEQMLKRPPGAFHLSGSQAEPLILAMEELKDATGFSRVAGVLRFLHGTAGNSWNSSADIASATVFAGTARPDHLLRVISLLRERCLQPVTLQQVAEAVGLRKQYICRLFQQRLNTTFTRYRDELRVRYALELLQFSDQSVQQISYACGYKSPAQFSFLFKAITGEKATSVRSSFANVSEMEKAGELRLL